MFDSLYLPMIESISHMTFIVKNVERTARLFRAVFDAEEVYDSAGKNFSISYEKFFKIAGVWVVLMEGDPLSDRSYNHVAFKVPEDQFDQYVSRIKQLNLEIKPGRDRVDGEARSLYFYVMIIISSSCIPGPSKKGCIVTSAIIPVTEVSFRPSGCIGTTKSYVTGNKKKIYIKF